MAEDRLREIISDRKIEKNKASKDGKKDKPEQWRPSQSGSGGSSSSGGGSNLPPSELNVAANAFLYPQLEDNPELKYVTRDLTPEEKVDYTIASIEKEAADTRENMLLGKGWWGTTTQKQNPWENLGVKQLTGGIKSPSSTVPSPYKKPIEPPEESTWAHYLNNMTPEMKSRYSALYQDRDFTGVPPQTVSEIQAGDFTRLIEDYSSWKKLLSSSALYEIQKEHERNMAAYEAAVQGYAKDQLSYIKAMEAVGEPWNYHRPLSTEKENPGNLEKSIAWLEGKLDQMAHPAMGVDAPVDPAAQKAVDMIKAAYNLLASEPQNQGKDAAYWTYSSPDDEALAMVRAGIAALPSDLQSVMHTGRDNAMLVLEQQLYPLRPPSMIQGGKDYSEWQIWVNTFLESNTGRQLGNALPFMITANTLMRPIGAVVAAVSAAAMLGGGQDLADKAAAILKSGTSSPTTELIAKAYSGLWNVAMNVLDIPTQFRERVEGLIGFYGAATILKGVQVAQSYKAWIDGDVALAHQLADPNRLPRTLDLEDMLTDPDVFRAILEASKHTDQWFGSLSSKFDLANVFPAIEQLTDRIGLSNPDTVPVFAKTGEVLTLDSRLPQPIDMTWMASAKQLTPEGGLIPAGPGLREFPALEALLQAYAPQSLEGVGKDKSYLGLLGSLHFVAEEYLRGERTTEQIDQLVEDMWGWSGEWTGMVIEEGLDPYNYLIPAASKAIWAKMGTKKGLAMAVKFGEKYINPKLIAVANTMAGEGIISSRMAIKEVLIAADPSSLNQTQLTHAGIKKFGEGDYRVVEHTAGYKARTIGERIFENPFQPLMWIQAIGDLSPASQVHSFISASFDHLNEAMVRADMDVDATNPWETPHRVMDAIMKGSTPDQMSALGEWIGTNTTLMTFRQSGVEVKHAWDNYRREYEKTGRRHINDFMDVVAQTDLMPGTIFDNLVNLKKDPNRQMAYLQSKMRQGEMLNMSKTKFQAMYKWLENNPWHPDLYRAKLMNMAVDVASDWAIDTFGVKNRNAYLKLADNIKAVQSMILLGYNPSYLRRNIYDNIINRMMFGVYGFVTPKTAENFFAEWGWSPFRLGEGFGAAEGALDGKVATDGKETPEGVLSENLREAEGIEPGKSKFSRAMQKVSKSKLWNPAIKASSKAEKSHSTNAVYFGIMRAMPYVWNRSMFADMPTDVREYLERSGLSPEHLLRTIESARNQGDLRQALSGLSKEVRQKWEYRIGDVATRMGLPVNILKELMAADGIGDKLNNELKINSDPGKAIENVIELAENKLAELNSKELRERMLNAQAVQGAEGLSGTMDIWVEHLATNLEMIMRSQLEWNRLYEKRGNVSPEEFNAEFQRTEKRIMRQWKEHWARMEADFSGFLKAAGYADPAGIDASTPRIKNIVEAYHSYAVAYDKFFEYRNEMRMKVDRNSPQSKAEFAEKMSQRYSQHSRDEVLALTKLRNEFVQMIIEQSPNADPALAEKLWDDTINNANYRHALVKDFYDAISGKNVFRTPEVESLVKGVPTAQVPELWSKFWKDVYNVNALRDFWQRAENMGSLVDSVAGVPKPQKPPKKAKASAKKPAKQKAPAQQNVQQPAYKPVEEIFAEQYEVEEAEAYANAHEFVKAVVDEGFAGTVFDASRILNDMNDSLRKQGKARVGTIEEAVTAAFYHSMFSNIGLDPQEATSLAAAAMIQSGWTNPRVKNEATEAMYAAQAFENSQETIERAEHRAEDRSAYVKRANKELAVRKIKVGLTSQIADTFDMTLTEASVVTNLLVYRANALGVSQSDYLKAHEFRKATPEDIKSFIEQEMAVNGLTKKQARRRIDRVKGAYNVINNKRVIYAVQNYDASTVVHELFHSYVDDLVMFKDAHPGLAKNLAVLEKEFGVVDGKWTTQQLEKAADTWLHYFSPEMSKRFAAKAEGPAPRYATRGVLNHFSNWLGTVWNGLKTTVKGISPEVAQVFDKAFLEKQRKQVSKFKLGEAVRPGDLKGVMWAQADKVGTPAFQAWFRESKVVDANGNPMIVYHGTHFGFEFDTFDTLNNSKDLGSHFGTDVQANARLFPRPDFPPTDAQLMGARLMPVYLSVQNPLVLEKDPGGFRGPELSQVLIDSNDPRLQFIGQSLRDKINAIPYGRFSEEWLDALMNTTVDTLEGHGFDGIKYRNQYEGKNYGVEDWSWMTWDPAKIKSVFNQGTWSMDDPRMLYQQANITPESILARLKESGMVPAERVAQILDTNVPEYLTPVVEYILEKRKKLLAGQITPRDVAKAQLITVASQHAKEWKLATVMERAKGYGIDFEIAPEFILMKNGEAFVRPEEYMAAWLGTPDGQALLDAIEAGNDLPMPLRLMATNVRQVFGNDQISTANLFGEVKGNKVNLTNLVEWTARLNELGPMLQDNPDAIGAISKLVERLNGVGMGKLGFIKHFLGMGESPTIDAIELNLWIAGQADRSRLQTKEADLLRDIGTEPSLVQRKNIREYLETSIGTRLNELRGLGYGKDLPEEVFGHIMHHWLWDSAKGTTTTHEGVYKAMAQYQLKADGSLEPMPDAIKRALPNGSSIQEFKFPHRLRDSMYVGLSFHDGEFLGLIPAKNWDPATNDPDDIDFSFLEPVPTDGGMIQFLADDQHGNYVYLDNTGTIQRMKKSRATGEEIPVMGPLYPGNLAGNGATIHPGAQINSEIMRNVMIPMLREMGKELTQPINTPVPEHFQNMPASVRASYTKWDGKLQNDLSSAKLLATKLGLSRRDMALLNYNRRVRSDAYLFSVMPYAFWWTRSANKWGLMAIDRPGLTAAYLRLMRLWEEHEDDNFLPTTPQRVKGKIAIPARWLPDALGDVIYYDAMGDLFPLHQFVRPYERIMYLNSRAEEQAGRLLDEWAKDGMITGDMALAIYTIGKGGELTEQQQGLYDENQLMELWHQAMGQARAEENATFSDMLATFIQPNLAISSAIRWLGGDTPFNSLPLIRTFQGIGGAFGTDIHTILNDITNQGFDKLVTQFGDWGRYYVDRMLSNMAALEPSRTNDILMQMMEGAGDLFDQAKELVQYEQSIMGGFGPLYGIREAITGEAGINGLIGGVLAGFFPGTVVPQGEIIQRGLKLEYDQAWKARNAGDPDALNDFFEAHPEFKARLALFDTPEERLRQWAVDALNGYYWDLSYSERQAIDEAFGDLWKYGFTNKETNDYRAIPVATLYGWMNQLGLGKQIPSTAEIAAHVQTPTMPTQEAITAYKASTEAIKTQNPYYQNELTEWQNIPEGERELFLRDNPAFAAARDYYYDTVIGEYVLAAEPDYYALLEERGMIDNVDKNLLYDKYPWLSDAFEMVNEGYAALDEAMPGWAEKKANYEALAKGSDARRSAYKAWGMSKIYDAVGEIYDAVQEKYPAWTFVKGEFDKASDELQKWDEEHDWQKVRDIIEEHMPEVLDKDPNYELNRDSFYNLPESERSEYLNWHPRLEESFDIRRQYKEDFPEYAEWAEQNQRDEMWEGAMGFLQSVIPDVRENLYLSYATDTEMSPATRNYMYNRWVREGQPYGNFEVWIDSMDYVFSLR